MTEEDSKQPSIHDWLALGELEVALAPHNLQSKDDSDARRRKEIRRLPLLLRMLSASQPLSSIPSISSSRDSVREAGNTADPLVDQVTSRLENVAATHGVAEGVDALVSYHAPSISRKMSRLPPLKKNKRTLEWDIQNLKVVAASPLGPPRKKRRMLDGLVASPGEEAQANDADTISEDDDDAMSVDEGYEGSAPLDSAVPNNPGGGEADAVALDSQEAMTTKSLTEIAKLVAASLEPLTDIKDDEDRPSSLLLPVTTDALLSEPASDLDAKGSGGAVGGCDLGATVSALMHHTPVLRHRHVAVSTSYGIR